MPIKKKSTLSLVINTKNEEKNIKACIKSAKEIVDEIIVVDMQSNDKTVEIAKQMGAKVYSVPDYNTPDPVRNFAISKATSKWILILDGDERLPAVLAKKIVKIINDDQYDVIEIPYKNIHFDRWIKHTGWWPDYQDRVFRKGFVSCPKEVHTRYKLKGRILTLPPKEENSIIHYQTKKISDLIAKIDRYTSLEDYFDKEKKFSFEDVLNYQEKEFNWRFFEQKGYMDGMRGYILSRFMEFYRFLVFVKYWEKHNYPEFLSSSQLKETVERNKQYINNSTFSSSDQDHYNKIVNSKFYKFWRIYCNKKESLLGALKK